MSGIIGNKIFTSGLLGYWPMNGNSRDLIGENDGIENGDISYVSGKVGEAVEFSANINDYITLGSDIPFLSGADRFSCSFWIYFKTAQDVQRILGKWDYLVAGGFSVTQKYLLGGPSTGLYFFITSSNTGDAGGNATYTNENLSLNTWYNITLVYDGAQPTNITRAKIYVNGVDSTVWSLGTINPNMVISSEPIVVGKINGSVAVPANNIIDNIALWDRVLSESEIVRIYNNGYGLSFRKN